jgi:hypothetical protein
LTCLSRKAHKQTILRLYKASFLQTESVGVTGAGQSLELGPELTKLFAGLAVEWEDSGEHASISQRVLHGLIGHSVYDHISSRFAIEASIKMYQEPCFDFCGS